MSKLHNFLYLGVISLVREIVLLGCDVYQGNAAENT